MLSLASRHSECNYYPLVLTDIILMLERRIVSFDSQLPPLTITCLPVHCICSMLEAVLKFGLCANITFNPIPMLYATIISMPCRHHWRNYSKSSSCTVWFWEVKNKRSFVYSRCDTDEELLSDVFGLSYLDLPFLFLRLLCFCCCFCRRYVLKRRWNATSIFFCCRFTCASLSFSFSSSVSSMSAGAAEEQGVWFGTVRGVVVIVRSCFPSW